MPAINQSLSISNGDLIGFSQWLFKLQLSGKDSRIRTRFVGKLRVRLTEIEQARMELIRVYAEKDEAGKLVKVVDETGEHYNFSNENGEKFSVAFQELRNEKFIIDILESNKEEIMTIQRLTLETDYKFSSIEAEWYDRVCQEFEKIEVK